METNGKTRSKSKSKIKSKSKSKRMYCLLLTLVMLLGLYPGSGTEVQAAGISKEYWADPAGLRSLKMNVSVPRIRFGASNRLWAICGNDGGDLALLSTSAFAKDAFGNNYDYRKSNFIKDLEKTNSTYLGTKYFSAQELEKMRPVTVKFLYNSEKEDPYSPGLDPWITKSVPNKKLYLPSTKDNSSSGDEFIYVGKNNDIPVSPNYKYKNPEAFQLEYGEYFWLRQPGIFKYKNGSVDISVTPYITSWYMHVGYVRADGAGSVVMRNFKCTDNTVSVVPAMNLNMDTVLFGSAVNAGSSSYQGYRPINTLEKNVYTLRYKPSDDDYFGYAEISEDGRAINVNGVYHRYLVIQNEKGAYILNTGNEGNQTVTASYVSSMTAGAITNFKDCKVWIEYTIGRVTVARPATQIISSISSVPVTVDTPLAGAYPAAAKIGGAGDSRYSLSYCKWFDITDGVIPGDFGPGPEVTGMFEAGRVYRLRVSLGVKNGYLFKENAKVTINGGSPDDIYWRNTHGISFDHDFIIPKPIDSVGVTVTEPVEGGNPQGPRTVGTEYYVSSYAWFQVENGVEGAIVKSGDILEAGKTYRLKTTLEPKKRYRFKTYSTVTINGKTADKIVYQSSSRVNFYHDFTVPALKTITTVDISGITLPVVGQAPDHDVKLPDGANYHIATDGELETSYLAGFTNGVCWRDSSHFVLKPSDTFKAGEKYYVTVALLPNTGYKFNGNINVTMNGKTDLYESLYMHGSYNFYSIGLTPTAKPATAYTLTTSVSGGNGIIEVLGGKTVYANGESATLVFHPNAGYDLNKVTVNGVQTVVSTNKLTIKMDGNKTVIVTYKKEGNTPPPTGGVTVSGNFTSFGDKTKETIIQLIQKGSPEAVDEASETGNSGSYIFKNVQPGTYTIKVMKTKHCMREYTIKVAGTNVTRDVEIWLYGDVDKNGDVNALDATQINRYAANISSVLGRDDADKAYRMMVADVNGDKLVDARDATQINRKVAHMSSQFDKLP